MDIQQGLNDAWAAIATFVPKLLAFLVILLIGWIVARVLQKGMKALLNRVGFDRLIERGAIGQAMSRTKYDASGLVAKLLYYAVLLITLTLAFGVFGPNPISDLLRSVVAWLPQAAVAILIIVVAAAIAKAVKDIISGALGGLSYGNFLANLASIFIIGLGVIAALNQIGVATTVTTPVLIAVLAAVVGVLVVGVGGGLVRPMQQRWERWLSRAEEEVPVMQRQMQSAPRIGEQRAGRYDEELEATRPQPGSTDPGLRE